MWSQPDTHLRTIRLWLLLVVAVGLVVGAQPAAAGSGVGSFEIEGNLIDDSGPGEPLDWQTFTSPPFNRVDFSDKTGQGDDIFGLGSKELEPGGWKCVTGSAPGKDDIRDGSIGLRTIGGKQFLYMKFFRAAVNGDAHIDYEFNKSTASNPSCPALPARTSGDVLLSFDTENGGATHRARVRVGGQRLERHVQRDAARAQGRTVGRRGQHSQHDPGREGRQLRRGIAEPHRHDRRDHLRRVRQGVHEEPRLDGDQCGAEGPHGGEGRSRRVRQAQARQERRQIDDLAAGHDHVHADVHQRERTSRPTALSSRTRFPPARSSCRAPAAAPRPAAWRPGQSGRCLRGQQGR